MVGVISSLGSALGGGTRGTAGSRPRSASSLSPPRLELDLARFFGFLVSETVVSAHCRFLAAEVAVWAKAHCIFFSNSFLKAQRSSKALSSGFRP